MICAKILAVSFALTPLTYQDHVAEAISGKKTQRSLSEIQRTVSSRIVKDLSCETFWMQDANLIRSKDAPDWAVVPQDLAKTGVLYRTCLPCHASPVASLKLINQLPDLRRVQFQRWLRKGDPI